MRCLYFIIIIICILYFRRVKDTKETGIMVELNTAIDTYLFRDNCYIYWILLETTMSCAMASCLALVKIFVYSWNSALAQYTEKVIP